MGDDFWNDPKASTWQVATLGPQDHLEEFSKLSKVPVDDIMGYAKNTSSKPVSPPRDDFQSSATAGNLYKPKDLVFLPRHTAMAGQSLTVAQLNAYSGDLPEMKVEIRFRALRLPRTWSAVTRPAGVDGKIKGGSPQDRWSAQWDDFILRAEAVEDSLGLTFNTLRVPSGAPDELDAGGEATPPETKAWFKGERWFLSGNTFDIGSVSWADGPKRLRIHPSVPSALYRPGPDVVLELALKTSGFFLRVDCTYLVKSAFLFRPDPGKLDGDPEALVPYAAATPTPFVPDFSPPRLVTLGPFHRVFEIVYRLPYDRGNAAAYSARKEIKVGADKYNAPPPKSPDDKPVPDNTWWDVQRNATGKLVLCGPGQTGIVQAGSLINKYRLWPKVSSDPKARYDYAAWMGDSGTPDSIIADPVPKGFENWCGFFQGFNYTRAGYDNQDSIKIPGIIGDQGAEGRRVVFFSGQKLMAFFTRENRPWIKFPELVQWGTDKNGNPTFGPHDRYYKGTEGAANRKAFLDKVLARWAPRRGDVIVVSPHTGGSWHRMDHVAMVWDYDPATYQMITLEGNDGPDALWARAAAWSRDLSDPDTFAFPYGIGRFLEGDFDRGVDPDLADALSSYASPAEVFVNGGTKEQITSTQAAGIQ